MDIKLRCSLVLSFLWAISLFAFPKTEKDTLSTTTHHNSSLITSTSKFVMLEDVEKQFPLEISEQSGITHPEFTYSLLEKEYQQSKDIQASRAEVAAMFDQIEAEGKWVDSFRNENIQTLPLGITYTPKDEEGNDDDGVKVELGLVTATVNTQYIEFTAFARITIPQTDKDGNRIQLFFGANNLKMTHKGGIIGDANLVLLGDVHIPWNGGKWLLTLKGGMNLNTGNVQNLTYFNMDCDGLKELGIQAEVQFSRDMILPVGANGEPMPKTRSYQGADGKTITIPNRVTGNFGLVASGWNDIVAEVSLSPFVLASMPKAFMFSVNKAIFDFSDRRTLHNNFPQFYRDNGLLFPNVESWRGFYVESLKIGMPEAFQTEESITKNQRVSFEAYHMIIDDYGLSGYFAVNNIIPLSEGRTNKSNAWAMSVDQLGLELAASKFVGASFDGRILLPISDKLQDKVTDAAKDTTKDATKVKRKGLAYSGLISEDEFMLRLSSLNEIKFNIWKAKARLAPNSAIELRVKDGNFRPKAILHGDMTISADINENETVSSTAEEVDNQQEKEKAVSFKGITFQDLVLQTESPIFQVGYFGYKGEVKVANFPVSIGDIALTSNDQGAAIGFDLMINLMGKESKGFAAKARLGIFCKFREENRKQRWKYDRIDLSEIHIKANMGAIQLEGGLTLMNNDPEYGDGFSAYITGTFGSFGPISCKAIFGKKEFRYWYVDASVHGLMIQAGPITITGFAGGAFYKMTKRPGGNITEFSPSGLSYIPNKSTSLGVKAMVFGSIGSETAVAVGAGFEIEFNTKGGVNRLGFFGEASIMKAFDIPNPVGKLTEKLGDMANNELVNKVMDSKAGKTFLDKADMEYEAELSLAASISAKLGMEFDFVNKSFHAQLDIFVNVGGGIVQGRASGGRAGWGVVHISPDEWYMHMGTPTDRLGLKMGIGSFSIETGGYFMVGDRIPGSPPPPPEVAEILGVDAEQLDYMRDLNALGEGRGFAFGADFKIDTGDLNFLILYARFQAGVGFDIMLKDYGEARCVNTGDQVGIDGWYANGQSYAYLQGEMGINIKLFFVRKKIPIIKGGAAILMQGKGPNPFWFRGYAGGYYNLLGGLVKGRFRFKVTIGKECELENAAPLGGIKMIADLTPKEGTDEVDVFAAPQATFSMKVGEPIVIPEDEADKTYKVILEKFRVLDANGKEVPGELEWSYMKDRATFYSEDILTPDTQHKVEVEVSFQEKIDGIFKTIMVDGKKAIETETRSFVTGQAPDHIPLHNILYAYPVIDQKQYYRDEYKNGYIQLRRGQDYLFDDSQWKSEIVITDETGKVQQPQFSYNTAANEVQYALPRLDKETRYQYQIVSLPKQGGSSVTNSSSTRTTNLDANNTVQVTTQTADNVSQEGSIERLGYEFSSSKYNTFVDKIKSISVTDHLWSTTLSSDIVYLVSNIKPHEGFEILEIAGSKYTEHTPLVHVEATLADTYFTQDIDPVLYTVYPENGPYLLKRDITQYGFRPKKAIPVLSFYRTGLENQSHSALLATSFPYRYNLPLTYYMDFRDIENQVLNDYVDGRLKRPDSLLSILDNRYLYMRSGKYMISLYYTLPGSKKTTKANYVFKHTNTMR